MWKKGKIFFIIFYLSSLFGLMVFNTAVILPVVSLQSHV